MSKTHTKMTEEDVWMKLSTEERKRILEEIGVSERPYTGSCDIGLIAVESRFWRINTAVRNLLMQAFSDGHFSKENLDKYQEKLCDLIHEIQTPGESHPVAFGI